MLNQITKELLNNYEFSIFSDKDSQINIKLDQNQDRLNTLKVKALSSNVDQNSLIYNGLKFKNLDLSQEQRIRDLTQKIDNARNKKIKSLKASQLAEYNQKSAEFTENTSNKINKFAELKIGIPGDDVIVKKTAKSFEEAINNAAESAERVLKRRKEKQRL